LYVEIASRLGFGINLVSLQNKWEIKISIYFIETNNYVSSSIQKQGMKNYSKQNKMKNGRKQNDEISFSEVKQSTEGRSWLILGLNEIN
jgi:hypothetical protein